MSAHRDGTAPDEQEPHEVLGLQQDAGPEEIRAAYLREIREHPPDLDPVQFQRIRDAHALLQDPVRRAGRLLFGVDPKQPLSDLLRGVTTSRRFLGPRLWLAVLKRR